MAALIHHLVKLNYFFKKRKIRQRDMCKINLTFLFTSFPPFLQLKKCTKERVSRATSQDSSSCCSAWLFYIDQQLITTKTTSNSKLVTTTRTQQQRSLTSKSHCQIGQCRFRIQMHIYFLQPNKQNQLQIPPVSSLNFHTFHQHTRKKDN